MTAAPKDFELNIPLAAPKAISGTKANLLNWRNWIATVIAVIFVVVAVRYSFMSVNARKQFLKIMHEKLN